MGDCLLDAGYRQETHTVTTPANDSPCRNCGGRDFFSKRVLARGGYGPDLLPVGGFFDVPTFRLRVCGGCGLAEWFVPEPYLAKVRERFDRERPPV